LEESQPAFYIRAVYQLGKTAEEFEQERITYTEKAKEDAEIYTAYCVARNDEHEFMRSKTKNKYQPTAKKNPLTIYLKDQKYEYEGETYHG